MNDFDSDNLLSVKSGIYVLPLLSKFRACEMLYLGLLSGAELCVPACEGEQD